MLKWMGQSSLEEQNVALLLGMSFTKKSNSVLEIPEILLQIIRYLPKSDIATLASVCKKYNGLLAPMLYQYVCFHETDRLIQFLKSINPQYKSQNLPFIERIVQAGLDAITNSYHPKKKLCCQESQCEQVKSLCVTMKAKRRLFGRPNPGTLLRDLEEPCIVIHKNPSPQIWRYNPSQRLFATFTKTIVLVGLVLPLCDYSTLFDHVPSVV